MTQSPLSELVESIRTDRKIAFRLLPFLCILYFIAYLDRIGLAYAGPNGMNAELKLTATTFGFAAGIFFLGYILFEIPSNVALHRFGARAWLARIIVSWGLVQTLTAFAPNPTVLYLLRFLLGVAEAGFAPGVILYLTYWFSKSYRGRAISRFMFSTLFATIAGAPLALWLITIGDDAQPLGMVGWRFLLFATGVPAVVLGVVTWFYLDDGPEKAAWLSQAEKARVKSRLAAEDDLAAPAKGGVKGVLRSGKPWLLGLCYFSFVYGAYALTFFLPSMVAGFQQQFEVTLSPVQIALLTAVPFCFGGAGQLWLGRRADKKGKLGQLAAATAAVGMIGSVSATFAANPLVLIISLCLMSIGVSGGATIVSIMASRMYSGVSAAAGIALVNTVGVSAGFFGPYITGWLRDATSTNTSGILLIAALLVISGAISVWVDRGGQRPDDPTPSDTFDLAVTQDG